MLSKVDLENHNSLQVTNNWHLLENVSYHKGSDDALKYIKIHNEKIKLMVPSEN